jgi:uncharacterized membrane protein YgcG
MKLTSAVLVALTTSCALAACESPPKPAETLRIVKAPSDLADLGVAGYRLHPPRTTDAPGTIEFLDANRATIGKMTSSTARAGASVSTTMTIEGLGNVDPIAITDETVGDGTVTRVTIRRGAETTTYEHDASGTFLVAAAGRIPVDDEHETEVSAALTHTGADPRFRVFAALSQDPKLAQAPELKGMLFNHKSPLCTSILAGAAGACVTVCMAVLSPMIPITLPACLLTCGIAAADWAYCQYEASTAVNDAQCDMNSPPGYIGRADVTEHQCLRQCDQSRCDGFCKNQPGSKGGYCSFDYCTCTPADENDDGTGGGGFDGGGFDGGGFDGGGGGGTCTWCDCTSESGEYHGAVCGDTVTELIDECWGSC